MDLPSFPPSPSSCACLVTQSCPTLCDPMDCSPPGFSVHGESPGKNTGVGCHALLPGIFPTQGLSPGLPHCRRILYRLSHRGSPHLFSCRNKMRKYWPHSAPICLLVTPANWNLAQVYGAQTYQDDLIFLDKVLKKSVHLNLSFTMSGQGPVCVFFSDLRASIWQKLPRNLAFVLWRSLAPLRPFADCLRSQFMKVSQQSDKSRPFRRRWKGSVGSLCWLSIWPNISVGNNF